MPRGKTKFDRCVKAVSKRGGAYDPKAVCGAMRARGELNPDFSVSDLTDAWMAGVKRGEDLYRTSGVSGSRIAKESADTAFKTWWDYEGGSRSPLPKSKARSEWMRGFRKGRRSNPAETAAEAFKKFHGQDPREYVTVTKKIHYHRFLFSIGDLVTLKIRTEDQRAIVTLNKFNGTILAGNEQAFQDLVREGESQLTQMFIEGGNQHVNLRDFGIDPNKAHEVETLGKAIKIDYHAVKVHLGSEGGEAVYGHKFRTTLQGDKHVKLRVAKYPDVIYRVLDEQIEFSGGSYELRAEGIDK